MIGHKGLDWRIEMKVMAADKAGAEIFFVPDDKLHADLVQSRCALTTMRHFSVLLSNKKVK